MVRHSGSVSGAFRAGVECIQSRRRVLHRNKTSMGMRYADDLIARSQRLDSLEASQHLPEASRSRRRLLAGADTCKPHSRRLEQWLASRALSNGVRAECGTSRRAHRAVSSVLSPAYHLDAELVPPWPVSRAQSKSTTRAIWPTPLRAIAFSRLSRTSGTRSERVISHMVSLSEHFTMSLHVGVDSPSSVLRVRHIRAASSPQTPRPLPISNTRADPRCSKPRNSEFSCSHFASTSAAVHTLNAVPVREYCAIRTYHVIPDLLRAARKQWLAYIQFADFNLLCTDLQYSLAWMSSGWSQ
jgi:hypothetical protein